MFFPPAISTADVERAERRDHGRGRRGLRVVEVRHPTNVADQLDPMREAREIRQDLLNHRRRRAHCERRARGREAVGQFVRERPRHCIDRAQVFPLRAHEVPVADACVAAVDTEGDDACRGECGGLLDDLVLRVQHRHVSLGLVAQQLQLGTDVVLDVRVPVEMVGRQVRPHTTSGWNVTVSASWKLDASTT